MANYVLVHGAWAGNFRYERTVADLEAAGHRVFAATLTGLGTRQDELHPCITLTDHVDTVCDQIEAAGFERFILVGHSYGGMVVTGVATRLGSRIDAICYIDAFLPEDGQSLWDLTDETAHNWYIDRQKFRPGLIDPLGTDENFEVEPGIRGYHPLLTLLEAVQFTGEEAKIPRHAYVLATGKEPRTFLPFGERAKADPAWEYHEVKSAHQVMSQAPQETARILFGLAE